MRADDAPIESPCDEDLDRMRLDPDGLRRHCDRCSKAVHDLSAMGPERARALLAGTRESICISYTMDGEGKLLFDSPRPTRPAKSDFVPLARLAQAATLAATLSACTPHGEEAPMKIQDSAAEKDRAIEQPAPVVIPNQAPPPPKPPEPEVEEPCEPQPEPKPDRYPVKGKRVPVKTAGVYLPDPANDPLL
jgi:hypothetical protein